MKVNLINDSLDRNHSFSQINQQNLIKEPLKNINHNSKSSELTKIQVHDRVDILDVNSYRKINYRMNNQLMLPISSDENLLKLALDKIHYKMKQGEVLTKEDFDSLSKVLLSQDFALNIRKEFVTLVHKYINTQKKLPRIFLDSLEKAKIATTDPLKKDINLILTRALLINQQLTKPSSKVKGGLFEKRGNLIVTRENVAVKRTNNFRSNILDLNLDKKATVQKGKELTLSKKVNSQKLPELPDNGNNKAWYRSSLIEVQNYLCLARSNAKLTKEDFDYLYTCLYSNNKEHQIARADPGIFEILKHTTYYGQQLPKKFIPVIENVLTGKILNTSGNEWSNAIKETFNTYTLSLTNRYSLSNCENQSDIAWCIGKVAPSILCNLAGQAQILEPSTLDSMHYSLSNKKDEHGLILYTFGIASRNQDLKERFEKITPLIKIDNNVLPIVTSAAIEALTRYSVDISKNALNFLEKTLEKFDKNNAIFFFGKKDTRESSSYEKRYSWRDSHYEAVNKFFNISNKGEDLTLGELKYLKDHIKQDYVGNKDLMKNCTALIILKKVTYNGQKLPPETINVLEKLVTTKDIDTKKQITFILGCVLRNGQNVASSAISEMEKVFDLGRKSSAYALGYHVEKYGTDNLPSTAMNSLKSILGRTHQDKEMRSAISFALNTIIQKSIKASITDLEDELLKNPELTSAFLNAVLKKEILSPKAIINLGKICSSRNIEIEIRRNASLTLSCAAENDTQIFPEDILENFVEVCLKNKDIDICNNSASFLGYQASKNIEVLATKHNVIKYLDEAIPNTEISINASFALQCIAENMDKVHPSTLKNFNILFETSGKMLVDGKYNTDTKCNIALSLAHAAKNGCKFTKDTIAKITELLSESDNQDINKPLLSALGYSAQYPELFSEASLSKIIFTLNSDKKDVSDSARAVLEKILTNKSYKLPESCLINLAQIVGEDNASVNSLHLLKQVIEHTNSLPIEALTLLSKALLNVSDIESLINISVVLARSSTEQKFTDEILNNIESGLDYEEWEIIDNLTLAVKNSANNGIKLSQDLIAVLSDIVIDESTTLTTKQNSTIAISLTSDKSKLNSEQVLSALLQSFDIQDVEISKALMLIFGNYFGNCFDYRLQNTNSLIVKQLENHLNDEHFIENGMYAISKVVANKYLLSEDTISFTSEVLIKFQDQKVRNYAKQVLQTYNDYHKITLDYVLNILKIESISSDLLLNPDAKTLLKLKNFAARGNELTITSFEAISNLTKTQYEKYQDEILEILKHIAINEQELPDLLVSNLVKKLKTVSLGQTSNIEQLTEILYRSSNSRQSMPEGLIEALETKVVEGYIDEYSEFRSKTW